MQINVSENTDAMAEKAATHAANSLRKTIQKQGHAVVVAATGASQILFLEKLVHTHDLDWTKTTMFHLDEYVGLDPEHPASFRRYLGDRLIRPAQIRDARLIDGSARDIGHIVRVLNEQLNQMTIDIAFIGIGENGHIAFNDPPADFETDAPYKIVDLDERCKQQQVNEGWFDSIDEVPRQAITMTVRQIMKSREIVCTVPGERKAPAIGACLGEGRPVTPDCPASILQKHGNCVVYLDQESAGLISRVAT